MSETIPETIVNPFVESIEDIQCIASNRTDSLMQEQVEHESEANTGIDLLPVRTHIICFDMFLSY
jgi:hypothetical protein